MNSPGLLGLAMALGRPMKDDDAKVFQFCTEEADCKQSYIALTGIQYES